MVTAMTYTGRVQENGTVLLSKEAQEQLGLQPGDEVQVSLNRNVAEPFVVAPNEKGPTALRNITALQEGMRYTDASQTDEIIREGRDGGMVGGSVVEPQSVRSDVKAKATHLPLSEYESTLALFKKWEEEAAQMTPEQQAEEDLATADLMENLEKNRLTLPIPNFSDHD